MDALKTLFGIMLLTSLTYLGARATYEFTKAYELRDRKAVIEAIQQNQEPSASHHLARGGIYALTGLEVLLGALGSGRALCKLEDL